jgi:short subunit dehydrogenase-like uncharacterized protein
MTLAQGAENSGKFRAITVFGGAGHTARFVAAELHRRGWAPILCGRDATKLKDLESAYPGMAIRTASVGDPASLDRALVGAVAVLNCAGPFADTAAPLIEAAMRARIPYLDVTAEPQAVLDAFERFDEPAKQAGIIVAPGLGFYGGFGDLMATAALGDWTAADEICIAIALDSWNPTRATRLTGQRSAGRRRFFVDGKLELLPDPPPMRDWKFPEPFGTQPVVGLPFGEVILISRHIKVPNIRSYLNLSPLKDIRDPNTPPPRPADDRGRSAQTFVIEAVTRRGSLERRAIAQGRDIYAVTAPIVVEAAERVLDGDTKELGTVAAGEVFNAREFLEALSPQHFSLEIRDQQAPQAH